MRIYVRHYARPVFSLVTLARWNVKRLAYTKHARQHSIRRDNDIVASIKWQGLCELIAKGPCGELRTQLYIGMRAKLLDKVYALDCLKEADELSKMLQGRIKHYMTKDLTTCYFLLDKWGIV